MVMAVIESLMWLIQPKCAATSPMTAVSTPMKKMDPTKAGQPLHLSEQRARRKNKTVSEGGGGYFLFERSWGGKNWRLSWKVIQCISIVCIFRLWGWFNSGDFIPGTEVPRATKAIALTESFKLMKQPKWPATSPITAVQAPMKTKEMKKQGYPLAIPIDQNSYPFVIQIASNHYIIFVRRDKNANAVSQSLQTASGHLTRGCWAESDPSHANWATF